MSLPVDSYSQTIRELVRNPPNRGLIKRVDGTGRSENPVCGDEVTVWITVEAGQIQEAGFEARGCPPSVAAGSVATQLIIGRSLEAARGLGPDDIDIALDGLPKTKRHCAVLAATCVAKAIDDFEQRR